MLTRFVPLRFRLVQQVYWFVGENQNIMYHEDTGTSTIGIEPKFG